LSKPITSGLKPSIEAPGVFHEVHSFWSKLITEAGPTPAGVDWPDTRRQIIRFRELCRLLPADGQSFSVLDYGCGYGALVTYLQLNGFACEYFGFDISEEMIDTARRVHPGLEDRFRSHLAVDESFDFVVLSGAFNRKQAVDLRAWENFVWNTIDILDRMSRKGFGFNVLSGWRDPRRKEDFLYYGDPIEYLQRVWTYSPNIAIFHDYDLWDFTILVRKDVPYTKDGRGHWVRT
jgi:SAM-dependent methyltransferase